MFIVSKEELGNIWLTYCPQQPNCGVLSLTRVWTKGENEVST